MIPSDATWLIPWRAFPNGDPEDGTARELYKEVGPSHILFGIRARPVGGRQDCDDTVFELLDGSGRFAAVHLTYSQHPEIDSGWPETEIFKNWSDFVRNRMQPDHDEWTGG